MKLRTDAKKIFGSKWISYLMIFVAAIIYTIGIQSFLNVADTFSAGLGSIAQLLTFTIGPLKHYFAFIYLALNIPLIIYFWKKIRKVFLIKTILFLMTQVAFGSLYLITGFNENMVNLMNIMETDNETWFIFINAFVGSFFVAFGITISWKYGGSSGGTDYIGYFYSTKKQKSVGFVLFIISITIVSFSFVINLILNNDPIVKHNWLIILVSTIIYISIVATTMNVLYPKYSKVNLTIHSSCPKKIIADFRKKGFNHAYNIREEISGYSGEKKIIINSVVLLLEVNPLLKRLYAIDKNIWVSETRISRVFGKFSTNEVEK